MILLFYRVFPSFPTFLDSFLFFLLSVCVIHVLSERRHRSPFIRDGLTRSADSAVVYEDADAGGARVDTVTRFSVIRCTYMFPFAGRWVRDLHLFTRQEVCIHVPKGSIEQGGYDFS